MSTLIIANTIDFQFIHNAYIIKSNYHEIYFYAYLHDT